MQIKRNAIGGLLAGCVVMMAVHGTAVAQDISPEHLQAGRQMIASIGATDAYDAILPAVADRIKTQLIQNNPDLEQQILDIVDQETLTLAARRADLENEAAAAYARVFSQQDLRAIADFYSTDAGKALLTKGPLAAREVTQAAVIWQRGLERDLLQKVGQRLRDAGLRPTAAQRQEAAPAQ